MFLPQRQAQRQQPSEQPLRIEFLDDPLAIYETQVNELLGAYEQDYALERRLIDLLHDVTLLYEDDERYRNCPRYLNLWLKYASFMKAPLSIYKYLQNKRIGEYLATFYEELAHFHAMEFRRIEAERVLRLGLDRGAQPVQRLRLSYEAMRDRSTFPLFPPRETGQNHPNTPLEPISLRVQHCATEMAQSRNSNIPHTPQIVQTMLPALTAGEQASIISDARISQSKSQAVKGTVSVIDALDQIEARINHSGRVAILQECYRFSEETSFEELFARAMQFKRKRKRSASMASRLPSLKKVAFASSSKNLPQPESSLWRHPDASGPLSEKRQLQKPQPQTQQTQQQTQQQPKNKQPARQPLQPKPQQTKRQLLQPKDNQNQYRPMPQKQKKQEQENPVPEQETPDQQTPDRRNSAQKQRPSHSVSSQGHQANRDYRVSDCDLSTPEVVRLPSNSKRIKERLMSMAQQSPHYHDCSSRSFEQRIRLDRFAQGSKASLRLSLGLQEREQLEVVGNLGQGGMANVFLVRTTSGTAALKVEAPPNPWEFYILLELHARQTECLRTIEAQALYVYQDSSFLILAHSRQGTLLDALNIFRSRGQGAIPEPLVILLASELLQALLTIHQAQIVHCDLKLDNVMLAFEPVAQLSSAYDHPDGGWAQKRVKLIDFGRAIDLTLFTANVEFIASWPASATDLPHIRQKQPWPPWFIDYWGLAAMAHLLLFGQPLAVVPTPEKHWRVRQPYKRYWHGALWSRFFHALLNPTAVASHTQPIQHELDQLSDAFRTTLATLTRTDSKLRSLVLQLEAAMIF